MIALVVIPVTIPESSLLIYLNTQVFQYDPESWDSLRTDGLIYTCFRPFWILGILYVVDQKYRGERFKFGGWLKLVFTKALPLFVAIVASQILIGLGCMALIVPGVYLTGITTKAIMKRLLK